MLLRTVEFNEKSINWDDFSKENNLLFLRYVEQHLRDILNLRGYVYLNQICEYLGVGWDPGCVNTCIRVDKLHNDTLWFELIQFDDGTYLVYIMNNE